MMRCLNDNYLYTHLHFSNIYKIFVYKEVNLDEFESAFIFNDSNLKSLNVSDKY
jgi:hypothetical protein